MQRTIVVGDVHGCADELQDLMRACGYARGDRLVLVGDIVAKGPDSQAVVQLVREVGGQAVMGNHDAHALKARDKGESGKPERQQLLDTLTEADWEFLGSLPLYLRLGAERRGEPETAVVHAGAVPGLPLEQQDREHLLTLRSIRDDGAPSKKIEGTPWAALWRGPERLVFGHDAVRGLQQHPMATGLDTGCVYGGKLSALVLPGREIVSVKARRSYVAW